MKYCFYNGVPYFSRFNRVKNWEEVIGPSRFTKESNYKKRERKEIKTIDEFLEWFKDNMCVYDCDGGDEDVYYVGLKHYGYKFFKIRHEYYAYFGEPNYENDTDGFECVNYFEVEEIGKPDWFPMDRDFLVV